MAYELINIGAAPNDGTGDPLRVAYSKVNRVIADLNGGTGTFVVVDENTKADIGQVLFVDTFAMAITIAPPDNPVLGSTIEIVPLSSVHNVTFVGEAVSEAAPAKFTYVSSTFGWVRR